MPISINLGRINTCKIVGTKDRFIENRCIEEPITEYECLNGQCVQHAGGQYATLAACLADPYVNSCITGGKTDSGIQGIQPDLYNFMATNNHHAVPFSDYYFEKNGPCVPTPSLPNPCYGPNGGCLEFVTQAQVLDFGGSVVNASNNINDLIAFLTGLGIAVAASDNYATIHAAIALYYMNHGQTGAAGLTLSGGYCTCTGCGSGPGVSFDCYDGPAGASCIDPGNGTGQFTTLADCNNALAAGGTNTCTTAGRTHALPGQIFDSIIHARDELHNIPNVDLSTVYFEVKRSSAFSCDQNIFPNNECCEGPNSTAAVPTILAHIKYIGFSYSYLNTQINRVQGCCTNSRGPLNVPFLPGNYSSNYGQDAAGNVVSWTYNDILQDAIAAGVTGVTATTPFSVNGNTAPGTFIDLVNSWLQANPTICTQQGGDASMVCPGVSGGPYNGACTIGSCGSDGYCECEKTCQTPTYDCDPKTQQCYDPGTGNGQFSGPNALLDCQNAGCGSGSGHGESYECIDGTCQDPGNGTGQYATLADCIASAGGDTCVSAAYTPAFAQPYCAVAPIGVQYDYMVSNGFTNVPLTNYKYESCGNFYQDVCLGPNGFEVWRFSHFSIEQQGINVHDFPQNATIDDLVAWCNTNIGPGFTNTMTFLQINQHSQTFPGWEYLASHPLNIRIFIQPCGCSDCGGTDLYDCVPGGGCQAVAGGQYATLAACQAANAPTDSCSNTTLIPTLANNPSAAFDHISVSFPSTDISTLSMPIVAGTQDCRPPLTANQSHCEYLGTPTFQFAAYTFIDTVTGGPLTGLAASYTKWSDFITAAQAIPIAGISVGTSFTDACEAINTHFGNSNGLCTTCPTPQDTDVVPGVWDFTNGAPNNPNGLGVPANGFMGINGIFQYITTQANGYTSKNGSTYFTGGGCNPAEYTIVPAAGTTHCNTLSSCEQLGVPHTAPNGCNYVSPPLIWIQGFVLPNGPYYTNWDALLADLVADGCPGVTLTSTFCDIKVCHGGTNTVDVLQRHYGPHAFLSMGTSICQCGTSNEIPQCSVEYSCCVCEDGCPEPEPRETGECLTLWLNAKTGVKTYPKTNGPSTNIVSPITGITQQAEFVQSWFNLAYDPTVGVYPYDPTAYYTHDTDFTTAPIYDTFTFAPVPAVLFDEYQNGLPNLKKYLIANPDGPAVKALEPDTNPNTAYDKGWTVFFLRCTSENGWRNSKSFFMGDDMSVSDPANKGMASGLKPAGQPYCRSTMFGHNHTDKTVPNHEYKASYIDELTNLQGELFLPEGCYVHWIRAKETIPTGTANNTFEVTWGIKDKPLFVDTMNDVDQDLIIQNINTRNRSKANAQAGWYMDIRAYNCAFNATQIEKEVRNIETHNLPSNVPVMNPFPCGEQPGAVTNFDGVDQTRVEVVEPNGNDTILPSQDGFTAAMWVRMNDCVDDDACFFEKGINLPGSNEEVAFRLFLSDDTGQVGNLYWDVFGDNPVDYLNNYSRTISNVPWLGEANCAALVGKWKHVAVTMDGLNGINRKIYVDGVDITGVTGGGTAVITGNVKRNIEYPLVIGDSSRPDFTFKGDFSQFITWNKALTAGEIRDVYNNGETWAPNSPTKSTLGPIMGEENYSDADRITFYTNFDTSPITHELNHPYTINTFGGVTLNGASTDVDNALLPTDIKEFDCWFKNDTGQLFDLDFNNNPIARASYMIDALPKLKDKIRLWECHGGSGKYMAPDATNTTTEKMLYSQSTSSNIVEEGGLYANSSKQLQIFHTRADGGIDFPAANGTVGEFTIMVKVRLEQFTNKAIYGSTSNNMLRINSTTSLRLKLGGAGSADFTIPSALNSNQPYIITAQRDNDGALKVFIDGGAFSDQQLTGTFTDADAFLVDYLGGVPSQGMAGWIFDFIVWHKDINAAQRKSFYRVINQTIKSL